MAETEQGMTQAWAVMAGSYDSYDVVAVILEESVAAHVAEQLAANQEEVSLVAVPIVDRSILVEAVSPAIDLYLLGYWTGFAKHRHENTTERCKVSGIPIGTYEGPTDRSLPPDYPDFQTGVYPREEDYTLAVAISARGTDVARCEAWFAEQVARWETDPIGVVVQAHVGYREHDWLLPRPENAGIRQALATARRKG